MSTALEVMCPVHWTVQSFSNRMSLSTTLCKPFRSFSIFMGVSFSIHCLVDFCFIWWLECTGIYALTWKSVCHSFVIKVVSACICNPQLCNLNCVYLVYIFIHLCYGRILYILQVSPISVVLCQFFVEVL